jgi:hypothetical protein
LIKTFPLVEHGLKVMAGLPDAVVIKAAGLVEDAGELHLAQVHGGVAGAKRRSLTHFYTPLIGLTESL